MVAQSVGKLQLKVEEYETEEGRADHVIRTREEEEGLEWQSAEDSREVTHNGLVANDKYALRGSVEL